MTAIKTHLTWAQFDEHCARIASKLRDFAPDLIVGISRGGLPLATVLAHHLGCRAVIAASARKTTEEGPGGFSLDSMAAVESIGHVPAGARRILIVDDIVALGDIFVAVRDRLHERIGQDVEIAFACLYCDLQHFSEGPYRSLLEAITYAVELDNLNEWIVFPWERDE